MNPSFQIGVALLDARIEYWLQNGWAFLILAFFVGSIPFGLVVSRIFFKTDIRSAGSGNIGAANALRTMGRGAGIAVLVLDGLKGAFGFLFPMLAITKQWFVPTSYDQSAPAIITTHYGLAAILGAMCAFAAILGHCYSPWLKFKGGKGIATLLGVYVVASWPAAVAFVLVWLAIVLPFGFASLGSILGTVAASVVLVLAFGWGTLYFSIPTLVLVIWKHRENISRLISGNENRLSLIGRKAASTTGSP